MLLAVVLASPTMSMSSSSENVNNVIFLFSFLALDHDLSYLASVAAAAAAASCAERPPPQPPPPRLRLVSWRLGGTASHGYGFGDFFGCVEKSGDSGRVKVEALL